MGFYRREKLSDLIIEELNKILLKEIEIESALITITDVEIAKDLNNAAVKFSVWPSEKSEEVLKILEKKQKYFQHLLLKKINIKPMPQISFKIDRGLEKAAEVEKRLLEDAPR